MSPDAGVVAPGSVVAAGAVVLLLGVEAGVIAEPPLLPRGSSELGVIVVELPGGTSGVVVLPGVIAEGVALDDSVVSEMMTDPPPVVVVSSVTVVVVVSIITDVEPPAGVVAGAASVFFVVFLVDLFFDLFSFFLRPLPLSESLSDDDEEELLELLLLPLLPPRR